MRFLLKILFAPILAVLAVVTWFFVFVVGLSSGILCIPAAILGFFGLFIIFVDSVSYGVGLLVVGVAKVQWTVDILRVKVGRWYLPGISALFYVDTIVWLFLFALLAIVLRHGLRALAPAMFFVGTLGICLLSPKSGEIRYLMPILYALPALLGLALLPAQKGGEVRA